MIGGMCNGCGTDIKMGGWIFCETCHANAITKIRDLEKNNEQLAADIKRLETKIKKTSEEKRAQEINPEN